MTIEGGPGNDKIIGGGNGDIIYGEGGEDKVKTATAATSLTSRTVRRKSSAAPARTR